MKKIIFEGYYGYKNTGDDAFVEVAAWGAAKYWQCSNNFFVGQHLPETVHEAAGLRNQVFPGQHKLESMYRLSSADAVVSAGGSTFEKIQNRSHFRSVSALKKRYSSGFKLGAIGVSLGPYKSIAHEKSIVEYLKRLDFLALRDVYSYELALSYHLPYKPINAFDLAALLPRIYNGSIPPVQQGQQKVIGISVCYFERYRDITKLSNEDRRTQYLLRLLHSLAKNLNVTLRFIEFNGNASKGDTQLTLSVISHLRSQGVENVEFVPYNPNTSCMYRQLVSCDVVLSVRLHASIFACFAGVPFFLVEYHRKCKDFLDSVGYHEAYRLGDGTQDIRKTTEQIAAVLDGSGPYLQPTLMADCQARSERNFTEVIV
ncbi:polysaccharide pyruvyl transferase family protein [Pontibacter mangrovi]|uniref:Polysaccharide pyruvyl transferase family protein n=1 Tax=Pontibacter mangrovi TaxID=2589816 RepID=A0A501VZP2_9BACT|nr:polysaccharide pyruvyl transferase family protein [Pontibacter mangrovi]TPE42508.1 polysaccharide pyruvyl transferase family protein [Pontibacter mangrovi]